MRHQPRETVRHVGHCQEDQPGHGRSLYLALAVPHPLAREDDEVHHVTGDADRVYDRL